MTFRRTDGWTLADEWFADYLRRAAHGGKRQAVLRDALPRFSDRHLAREREYDAQTERLRRQIRKNRQRQERRHA